MALLDPHLPDEPWVPEDTFGSRLARIRQRIGWNVKEAADHCGITDQTWRNWEDGGMPRDFPATCAKIADRTGCNLKWLMLGDQNWKKMNDLDLQIVDSGPVAETTPRHRGHLELVPPLA